jgi:hypothetical protein
LLALIFVLGGCYSPDIKDGQFTCSDGVTCPSGFVCVCNSCVKNASNISCADGGQPMDLAGNDLAVGDLATPSDMNSLPGCSAGSRVPNDPGKAKIALCPAAWQVPGIHPATLYPCSRMPDATGKMGGTDCTTEDNCVAGWHVCRDENDVSASGLAKSECAAIVNGFFLSAQKGGPPPSPGPPVCDNTNYHTVFGCGSIVQQGGAPNCTLFNAALLNPPDGTDHCSASTSGNFVCGSNSIEGDAVTKSTRMGGGVLCCHD